MGLITGSESIHLVNVKICRWMIKIFDLLVAWLKIERITASTGDILQGLYLDSFIVFD